MAECRLPSIYSISVHVIDIPRSSLQRWLTGQSRIPVSAASDLLQAIVDYAERLQANPLILELEELVRADTSESAVLARLRAELRARRVPVRRTIDALRALDLLPNGGQDG